MAIRFSGYVAAFVAAWAVAGGPAAAAPAGVGGDWVFHVDWGQLKYDMFCHLADDGGKLTGACQGYQGSVLNVRGGADATSLKLSYSFSYMQYDVTVRYEGTRNGGGGVGGTIQTATEPGVFDGSAPIAMTDQTQVWVLHTQIAGIKPYDLFCSFAQDGKTVRGPCVTAGGPVMRPAGSLTGTKVSFSYSTDVAGAQVRSQFDGTFDGDDGMEGTLSSDIGGTGTFKAHRR